MEGHSLKNYNTFGLEIQASDLIRIDGIGDLENFRNGGGFSKGPFFVLGGGSNVLFTGDFEGTVLLMNIRGREITKESDTTIELSIGAGEVWHDIVLYCVEKGWGGIENLSLIPGSVGAAPIQNIGAYGVELKDVFCSLEAYSIGDGTLRTFSHAECQFGYRDSVFKRELKGKYIITRVVLRLTKNPILNTSYGAIREELASTGKSDFTIRDVSEAVIRIRQSKLPDPKKIGNSGSFFKNPVISLAKFEELKKRFPDIVSYPVSGEEVKVPAGWLIDRAGWKGRSFGNYGVHKDQALVLVNYGGASGKDIYDLSETILENIREVYGITLEREVNVV